MNIEINLNNDEMKKVINKIGFRDVSLEELLNQFVQDLIVGSKTSGSDERNLANAYYERTFSMYEKNDSILARYGLEVIEDILFNLDEIVEFIDELNNIREDKYSLEELKLTLNEPISDIYDELKEETINANYELCLLNKKSIDDYCNSYNEFSLEYAMQEIDKLIKEYDTYFDTTHYNYEDWCKALKELEKMKNTKKKEI